MVDLSKAQFISTADAFKNQYIYTGSLTLPASVPPATPSVPYTQTSTTFTVPDVPALTEFFAFFVETVDAIFSNNNPQWYNSNISGQGRVGYPNPGGQLTCFLFPIINGSTITVVAQVVNQTAGTLSSNITVPFAFIGYTLAN